MSVPKLPEVVRVRTPFKSTGYDLAKVRLTFSWDAGGTFPLGPVMVYEGSAGGVLPAPFNGTAVLLTRSVPPAGPVAVGVNVIPNEVDWPAFRVSGRAGAGVSEYGLLVLMREMIAVDVPEFVMVNVTFSDWLTGMGVKSTASPTPTGMVVPLAT